MGRVTRPADVKRGKLPRERLGKTYGALAQLVARYIRIVEVSGSNPLCSTKHEKSELQAGRRRVRISRFYFKYQFLELISFFHML